MPSEQNRTVPNHSSHMIFGVSSGVSWNSNSVQLEKWRTGCEGRISVVKRRHGLARCRYHGLQGMRRWVGLGVIADNLINIGRYLAPRPV